MVRGSTVSGQKVALVYPSVKGNDILPTKLPSTSVDLISLSFRTNIQIASRTFQFLLATPTQDTPQSDSLVGQSPTPSVVDVVDSDPGLSPRPTLRDISVPVAPPIPLPTLCCQAIEAAGGKATLGQIRRWLAAEYEWYRVSEGWQVRSPFSAVADDKKLIFSPGVNTTTIEYRPSVLQGPA